ncbi:MAG: hypothetical protein GX050_04360 [Firmicutes bacterium]|nr:hypothetical protein [Bacillota bacterium]
MSLSNFPDHKLLTELEVLQRIEKALAHKKPFSLVRVGDGENIILAQGVFLSDEEFKKTYWVQQGKRTGGKGGPFTSPTLRKQVLAGIRQADVVGICRNANDEIAAPSRFKRPLTNKIFDHYGIKPANLCYVFWNRKIVAYRQFWKLLHKYRTLLISRWANRYANLLMKKYKSMPPKIVGCIDFQHYKEIPGVLEKVGQYRFDLALISAGVNAVILAPAIAQRYRKVAIDFGKTMMYTVLPNKRINPWYP